MPSKTLKRRPSAADLQAASLIFLALVAFGFVLNWLQGVLVPFVLAFGLQILVSPLVDRLQDRVGLPRWLAIGLVFLLAAGLLLGLGVLASLSVQSFLASLREYKSSLIDLASRADGWLLSWDLPSSRGLLSQAVAALPLLSWAQGLSGGVMGFLTGSLLTGLFLAFLLVGRERGQAPKGGFGGHINERVRKYLAVKLLASAVTGVLTAGILLVLGVDLALLFGLMAFLLNFIPTVGSIVAVLLPLPVLLLGGGSPQTVALALLLPTGVQFLVGNLIEPSVMGEALGLHPVTVLLGLLAWGSLWGSAGMLMAVPMTAVAKLLLERSPVYSRLARWMEGDFSEGLVWPG